MPDNNLIFIYGLFDPRTNHIRYVGKTIDPVGRYHNHLKPSELKHPCHRCNWLKQLLRKRLKPILAVLEITTIDCWKEAEKSWIAFYKSISADLVNMTKGGEGGMLPEWITDEYRQHMNESHMGYVRSEESKRKQSESQKGRIFSPATRDKISKSNKGKGHSEEWRDGHSKTMTGRKASVETKAKMGKARRGNTNAKIHDYTVITPSGREIEVASLDKFCKDHHLDSGSMRRLAAGDPKRSQHKGYRCKYR